MKLTPLEAVVLVNALSLLTPVGEPVPGRLALRKARITVPLEPHTKPFFEGREALLKELGGSVSPSNAEQWGKFLQGIKELEDDMSTEGFEVELAPIPASVVESIENLNEESFKTLLAKGLIALEDKP